VNVGLALVRSARAAPSKLAVFDGERRLTYRELDERASRFANVLDGRYGIERGDRIALLVHNRLEVVEVLVGAAKAGAVYVGLNFRLGLPEYEAIFENCTPRLLVAEREYGTLAAALAERYGLPLLMIDDDGPAGYEAVLADGAPRQPGTLYDVRPEDDFCIVYSSGTTGQPKGILFDHRAVLHHALVALQEYDYTADARYLIVIPHNSSVQITTVPSLLIGSAIGFLDGRHFDGGTLGAALERHRVTHTYLVPTQLYRLLEQLPTGASLPSLETLGYGAAPISPDRVGELLERFGPIFTQLYGMAEIASIGTMLRKGDHVAALAGRTRLLASCGRPSYAIAVRVVDDEGQEVATGERGEVLFAGPYIMKGYYRDPERTAETLVDGWVHSGDVAETDEAGYLYIVDRKKDLIIRGGLNIAPKEIENILYGHPAVLEVAVIGVPDTEWGEALVAVVALKDGANVGVQELADLCSSQGLPTIKVPERWEFVDSLPKTAVGKIAKRELRGRFWAGQRQV
jgi:acyl-CoA synthetase (AMP-forming)/AMP-acid ligase II